MKLVLFDIDGTLIYCGKAGRKSLSEVLIKTFNSNGIPDNYSLGGKTDIQIIYEILRTENIPDSAIDRDIDLVLNEYFNILKSNLESNGFEKKILPGIIPLLENLIEKKDKVIVGLLTGNLKKTAVLKLEFFNLLKYFFHKGEVFGAFGSDHISRSKIVEIAVDRAQKIFNRKFIEKQIVVIGDTNNDILCGKHLNVKSIAVATGEWQIDDLRQFEPDFLFEDFSDYMKAVQAIIL